MIIEGVPVDSTDPSRLYRGYIAIDDIDLQSGTSCVGFCNFAGGFCDWNNDAEDDFDWTIVSALLNWKKNNIYIKIVASKDCVFFAFYFKLSTMDTSRKHIFRVAEAEIPRPGQQWTVPVIVSQLVVTLLLTLAFREDPVTRRN